MEHVFYLLLIVSVLMFLYFNQKRRDRAEQSRFREFVIANKAKNIQQYVENVPDDNEFELPQQDEIVELNDSSINDKDLISAIKEYENN